MTTNILPTTSSTPTPSSSRSLTDPTSHDAKGDTDTSTVGEEGTHTGLVINCVDNHNHHNPHNNSRKHSSSSNISTSLRRISATGGAGNTAPSVSTSTVSATRTGTGTLSVTGRAEESISSHTSVSTLTVSSEFRDAAYQSGRSHLYGQSSFLGSGGGPSGGGTGARNRRRSSAALQELTINKLRLNEVGFYGRKEQETKLAECLKRVATIPIKDMTPKSPTRSKDEDEEKVDDDNTNEGDVKDGTTKNDPTITSPTSSSREVVWISGYSGSGKTTLARSIAKQVRSSRQHPDGIFVEGKFDFTSHEPLSGFLGVCRELCHEILYSKDSDQHIPYVRRELKDQLGEQVELITSVLPELSPILRDVSNVTLDDNNESTTTTDDDGERNNDTSSPVGTGGTTTAAGAGGGNGGGDGGSTLFNTATTGTAAGTLGNTATGNATATTMSTAAQSHQLKYIFRVFIQVVSTCFTPVVILLDDLQWASKEALDLLETITLNQENRNLLIIGCYRSDEVDEMHPFQTMMTDLSQIDKQTDHQYKTLSLEVGNLNIDDCNRILMDLLSIDSPTTTYDLAAICHQRTFGNAYFFIQFVSMLNDNSMLEFNLGLFKWTWNIDEIVERTAVSPNVVTLVRNRIKKSSELLLRFLKVLSCLGPLPSSKVIDIAWTTIAAAATIEKSSASIRSAVTTTDGSDNSTGAKAPSVSDDHTNKQHNITASHLIEEAIEANYIERSGTANIRFVHDKILEASLSLMTETEKAKLCHDIGVALHNELDDESIESEVFLIADLLNTGAEAVSLEDSLREDPEFHITVNMRAAEKAKYLSAFSNSLKYAMKGISLQNEDCWETNYEHTLRLYSVGAETAGSIGNIPVLDEISTAVLLRSDIDILDKLRVYNAKLDSMANNGQLVEATDLVCELLRKLDCKPPRSGPMQAINTIKEVLAIKSKPPSKDDILNLPTMTDRKKCEVMRLLYLLSTFSFLDRKVALWCWCSFQMLKVTMNYGLHEMSAAAFPCVGAVIVGVFGDFQTGSMIAKNGKVILEIGNYQSQEARIAFTSSSACSWYHPLQSLIKWPTESYKIGMQFGDTDR